MKRSKSAKPARRSISNAQPRATVSSGRRVRSVSTRRSAYPSASAHTRHSLRATRRVSARRTRHASLSPVRTMGSARRRPSPVTLTAIAAWLTSALTIGARARSAPTLNAGVIDTARWGSTVPTPRAASVSRLTPSSTRSLVVPCTDSAHLELTPPGLSAHRRGASLFNRWGVCH